MRKLGIDFGTKKIGLALTDEAGKMAFPHTVIPNDAALLDTIDRMIDDESVDLIVIGHSLDNDGEPNAVQKDIEEFLTDLTLRTPTPIHREPEQFTSAAAARTTGKNSMTDAAAAALILDSWLQKQAASTPVEQAAAAAAQEEPAQPEIRFEDFTKLAIKIGTIESVEVVPDADKLLKLMVDVGEASSRQILSGIREFFPDEQILVGRQCPFVVNLPTRKIRGLESQGMILAVGADEVFTLLHPHEPVPPGTPIS